MLLLAGLGYVVVRWHTTGAAAAPDTAARGSANQSQTAGGPDGKGVIGTGPSASAKASASASASRRPAAPPATSGFPGPGNTGVPAGTKLSPYTGSCTVNTPGLVIDSKVVNCSLNVRAHGVVIRKSKVVGRVDSDGTGDVTLDQVEVDDGTVQEAAIGNVNFKVYRSNLHGGEASANCDHNCLIQDSWLHGQYIPPNADWHLDAYMSNGGNHVTLIHNTIACDNPGTPNGGCSGDASIFGDFEANSFYTFDHNLFAASVGVSYCTYAGSQDNKPHGGEADHIVYINNVFQRGSNGKCGQFGPISAWDNARPGNVWQNNTWEDGRPLTA